MHYLLLIGLSVLALTVLTVIGLIFRDLRRNNWQWLSVFRSYVPNLVRGLWIAFGIVLPLAAITTERITEICARIFFDPLPTDWHLVLFALIPFSNLVIELSSIRRIRERAPWLYGPLLKWINGMAIGISGFYAAWFCPLALICSTLFVIGLGWMVTFLPWAVLSELVIHPANFVQNFASRFFWEPFGMLFMLAGLLLIPLAPFMSCLACLRNRKRLVSLQQPSQTSNLVLGDQSPVSSVHPGFIVLGLCIFSSSLYLLYTLWIPFAFSRSAALTSISTTTPFRDIFLTWLPPIFFFALLLLPTPISPLCWFPKKDSIATGPRVASKPFERLFLPVAFGLFALLAIEIPSTATRVAMSMAVDPNQSAQGLLLLRAFGNDDSMLRMCYERAQATDIMGTFLTCNKPVSSDKAREIYYRATGRPFNTRFVPNSFRGKGRDALFWTDFDTDDVFDWDAELAGETVGGVARGISLASSDIKGDIDGASHVANLDWEMQFENKSKFLREARAQILLPPHAVVSNVWLWINGTPHPAAFNSRGLTRAAYTAVVRKRRDPLLVTTYGPDRVLAQCFPVPPGGTMHIKLSITTPLVIRDDGKAYLPMPTFLERNFQVGSHSVELTSNENIASPSASLKVEAIQDKPHALKGNILNQDLCLGKGTVVVEGKTKDNSSWSDDIAGGGIIISSKVRNVQAKRPDEIVVVVDGSAAMASNASRLAQALKSIPQSIPITLIRAGDKVEVLAENIPSSSDPKWSSALDNLKSQTFVGGQDDVPALVKAFDFTQNKECVAILWVHGPQPVKIETSETLVNLLKRSRSDATIYELQMENGPNRTAEALDGIENVHRLPIIISDEAALKDLFSSWTTGGSGEYEMTFDKVNAKQAHSALALVASRSSVDISPLWANQEVAKLRSLVARDKNKDAVEIAKQYRVVTPVSGAVVLETDKDYQRFGLVAPTQNAPTHQGVMSALSSFGKGSTLNAMTAEKSVDAERPQFEQKAPSVSSNPHGSSGQDMIIPDGSPDVSAVPEPNNWLFLVSIAGILWLFRRKLALALSK